VEARCKLLEGKVTGRYKAEQARIFVAAVKDACLLLNAQIIPGSKLERHLMRTLFRADTLDPIQPMGTSETDIAPAQH
jgi:hypothetical protein